MKLNKAIIKSNTSWRTSIDGPIYVIPDISY